MVTEKPTRYRKRRRAEHEQQTRDRIAEAAMNLHQSVGPANTTVSAIAEAAGVQRATVYRHFPDDEAIFNRLHGPLLRAPPAPRPGPLGARSRTPTSGCAWRWPRSTRGTARPQPMLSKTQRDREHVPATAVKAFLGYFELIRESLMRGRRERGRRRARVAAAISHAVAFPTWVSLVSEGGLSDGDAIDLVAAMVASA